MQHWKNKLKLRLTEIKVPIDSETDNKEDTGRNMKYKKLMKVLSKYSDKPSRMDRENETEERYTNPF